MGSTIWTAVVDSVSSGVRQLTTSKRFDPLEILRRLALAFSAFYKNRKLRIAVVFSLVAVAVLVEAQTSWLQAHLFAFLLRAAKYELAPGPNPVMVFPRPAPYPDRLGYSKLPQFIERLRPVGFEVTAQARYTPFSLWLLQAGLYSFSGSKPQAGLRIVGRTGDPLFTSPYPLRTYKTFEEIPPIIVHSLAFIENREILDETRPFRNPAIEWDRLANALLDFSLNWINPAHPLSGGSTLATQIEKLQYSPGGRTGTPAEKARQLLLATLRSYRDGPSSIEARRRVIRDYLNTLPLAAIPGYGEVNGLGDGLWAWYGADFAMVNRLLAPAALRSGISEEQALAYRQVLSLLLAVNSPVHYLVRDPQSLEARTDAYLRLLARSGIIPQKLAEAALPLRPRLLRQAPPLPPVSFVERKGADAARVTLATWLGLDSLYSLDRLDLTARTTLDVSAQQLASNVLQRFYDPEFAAQRGLLGDRLLSPAQLEPVVYSFTLFERTPGANLLRIQTDSYNQPLNINEGTKLELGSTAKLRTLAHYLEIVADLHEQYAALPAAELEQLASRARDPLTRWAASYLASSTDRSLPAMLEAALARQYSASPAERFFTGGGVHYFANFDRKDNGRVMSVAEAFQRSVNLVFIRLMRDIVRYYEFRNPDRATLLEDVRHPARRHYLLRFAEFEGAIFLSRFYARYKGLDAGQLQAALAERSAKRGVHPLEIWLLNYMIEHPQAGWTEILEASLEARRNAYDWLFSSRRKQAQDKRIEIMLEREAFEEIHKVWKRLGFPFDRLVPSYATAIGSSGDTPAALAELAGVILNDGVRQPTIRIDKLHFAEGTPWETVLERRPGPSERVMRPEVAAALRRQLLAVVESGTARRAYNCILGPDGQPVPVGGKTGTGDNRIEIVLKGGRRVEGGVLNRTATFVFIVGDRFFGTVTAFVPGQQASGFEFTSALAVQAFRNLAPAIQVLLGEERGRPVQGSPAAEVVAMRR